jgi:hypothetical protein
MDRTPAVVGLTLCDLVIDEALTHKLSLVGSFTEILVDELPGLAEPFSAVTFLTDAQGVIDLELRVTDAATNELIETRHQRVYSPHPLAVVYSNIRVKHCSFPRPGVYVFSLWAGPELLAQRRTDVRRGTRP